MNRAQRIVKLVKDKWPNADVTLLDDSAKHAGHAGHRPEGETHYQLKIVDPAFSEMSRVARQRLVNQLLKPEFENGLHALELKILCPGE